MTQENDPHAGFTIDPNIFQPDRVLSKEEVLEQGKTLLEQFNKETRTVSSTGGEKGTKPQRYDLIPVRALAQIAEHYGVGALKYADNQWRKGYEWSKSYAALQRHANAFWAGEDFDEETGSNHMAAVAWHAFTLLTFFDEHPDFDDRFNGNDNSTS